MIDLKTIDAFSHNNEDWSTDIECIYDHCEQWLDKDQVFSFWDGKDFNGNKVHTGVYMIFNGSPEGELKAVAKILFVH